MLKRIFLFLVTNIAIIATISIVLNVLGVRPYITAQGIDYYQLMVFCLVWGMVGSFISLAMSRVMAKWMLGVKVIDPRNAGDMTWLTEIVSQQARAAQLPMPEVGVYPSPEVNAFATGPTKKRALVAFSSGLLQRMNRNEIAGVAGHELAHIKNGDMVTMTLIQGVVNAFVMFIARIIAFAVAQNVKEESRGMVHMIVVIALDILLSILASIVVCWFSRQREYRADKGGATLAGRENMIAALEGLKRMYGVNAQVEDTEHQSLATLKISGKRSKLLQLFSTHPELDERIELLKRMA